MMMKSYCSTPADSGRRPRSLALVAGSVIALLTTVPSLAAAPLSDSDRIRPYEGNPYCWQYKGEPVLLLGAVGRLAKTCEFDVVAEKLDGTRWSKGAQAHIDSLPKIKDFEPARWDMTLPGAAGRAGDQCRIALDPGEQVEDLHELKNVAEINRWVPEIDHSAQFTVSGVVRCVPTT